MKREAMMAAAKRVLIVDDEPDLLKSIVFRMRKSGYETIPAVTGEEALEQVAKQKPDLILLDWRLPGMSGTDVYIRLKLDPLCKDIPVVFLTASRDHEELKHLKTELGIEHIIVKPYEFKDLLAKVQQLIP